jgi:hypothetical protein
VDKDNASWICAKIMRRDAQQLLDICHSAKKFCVNAKDFFADPAAASDTDANSIGSHHNGQNADYE